MKELFAKITKLIDVKSIITLTVTAILAVVVLKNMQLADNIFQLFSSIAMLIFGFYFGKQSSNTTDQK